MNLTKLFYAEKSFLEQFPGGFKNEEMKDIGKKHKFGKICDYAHEVLSKDALRFKKDSVKNISKFISKTSMVSVFEKMRFRDFIKEIDDHTEIEFVDSIYELIHGEQEVGFNSLVHLLKEYNLAKWPLISAYLAYYNPTYDIFIKPTTVKGILKTLEVTDITYNSKPTYEFYIAYRDFINNIKTMVDPSLSPSNAALSGFMMMTFL